MALGTIARVLGGAFAGAAVGGTYGVATDKDTGKTAAMGALLGGVLGYAALGRSGTLAENITRAGQRVGSIAGKIAKTSAYQNTIDFVKSFNRGTYVTLRRMFPNTLGKNPLLGRIYASAITGALVGGTMGAAQGAVSRKRTMFGGFVRGALLGGFMGAGLGFRRRFVKPINPIKNAARIPNPFTR